MTMILMEYLRKHIHVCTYSKSCLNIFNNNYNQLINNKSISNRFLVLRPYHPLILIYPVKQGKSFNFCYKAITHLQCLFFLMANPFAPSYAFGSLSACYGSMKTLKRKAYGWQIWKVEHALIYAHCHVWHCKPGSRDCLLL